MANGGFMKLGIKSLFILNIICYTNSFILSYKTSLIGMNHVNQFWLVSPYLFIFISLYCFSPSYNNIRKYCTMDYIFRIIGIIVCYKGSNYSLESSLYIILISVTFVIFVVNIVLEVMMYKKIIKYCDNNNNENRLRFKDIFILSHDKEINNKFKESGKKTLRSLFNWWNLIFAWFIFVMSIVFLKTGNIYFTLVAMAIILITIYLVIKSILSHLIIIQYVDYDKSYIRKRKMINIGGIVLAFIYVFFITYFGSKDLSYANGLGIFFLLPFYRTEKHAILKNKENLDRIIEEKKLK